jgi:hypothetical protein
VICVGDHVRRVSAGVQAGPVLTVIEVRSLRYRRGARQYEHIVKLSDHSWAYEWAVGAVGICAASVDKQEHRQEGK